MFGTGVLVHERFETRLCVGFGLFCFSFGEAFLCIVVGCCLVDPLVGKFPISRLLRT